MATQRLRRSVTGDEATQFAARRFDGHEGLTRRRRKSLREDLEVVDERFHLRLHFFAAGGTMPGASVRIGPWEGILSMAWRTIFRLSRISATRTM